MRPRLRRPLSVLTLLVGLPATPVAAQLDPDLLAGMKARAIGPAAMSGRVAAVDAVVADPNTVYVGAATGGLWKSEDGGLTWAPLFDRQPVAAIGAVAVFQPHPDVVWVGTGEGNPRNSASVGNGVYRSLDGGRTWSHLGLTKTERIHRILLHPGDREVAYVAALGTSWGENPERGVFKTTDGGKTWSKVLYVDERTGAADLVMDPTNPDKLIAALWDHRRWPWFFRSGGPGSGLYLTHDGGATWKRLTEVDGLPKRPWGRIGLAIAPSDPKVVYALIEAEKNSLYRSGDGGVSWRLVNEQGEDLGNRPFYYADLRVDPINPNRVYSLWSLLSRSEDGGKTFATLVPFQKVHPDHHALWINPRDPDHLINGSDGGVSVSRDGGRNWSFVGNLPLAQFYHVRVDQDVPYHVYGGLQDNGSWRGPGAIWEGGGIRNHHWQEVNFGDGFDTVPDPEDSLRGYAMSQEGFLVRWNLRTGERKDIRPAHPDGVELRFNWNAGVALDPFDPATVYFGSQFVHRSTDRGESWTLASPDLTTDNPQWQKQTESGGLTPDVTGAENFTTIVAIAPSPVARGVIWVGTDDGRIHVTRDGGGSWASVEGNVQGVPENTWVPHIAPSPHDPATALAVFDDHRRANWTPYVYRTTDFGGTWKSLATPDLRGYALAIAQDPVDPNLLFLGTEFGLYVSVDGGGRWFQWTHGVPTVSVMDLAIQPREHDLVLGTHGRGIFILDDIRPLRGLSQEILARPLHLFPIPDAQQYRSAQAASSRFPGDGEFRGEDRPYGALVTYSLNLPGLPHPDEEQERARKEAEALEAQPAGEEEEAGPRRGPGGDKGPQVKVEIRDPEGQLIRTFEAPARLGVNRTSWNLRRDNFKRPQSGGEVSFFEPRGPEVLPGTYTVTVRFGEHRAEGSVEVLADPRVAVSAEDRRANFEAQMAAGALQETATAAIERLRRTRGDVATVLGKLEKPKDQGGDEEDADPQADLRKAAKALEEGLDGLERRLWQPPDTKGIPAEDEPWDQILRVQRSLGLSWDAPNEAQRLNLAQAREALQTVVADLNRFYAEEAAAFRQQVREAGIELLPEEDPIAVE